MYKKKIGSRANKWTCRICWRDSRLLAGMGMCDSASSPLPYDSSRLQDKRITIVQGDELLLNDAYPSNFRKSVAKSIRKRDVTVILNDRVDDMTISDAGIVTTRSGRKVVADLVVRLIQDVEADTVLRLSPDSLSRSSAKLRLRHS